MGIFKKTTGVELLSKIYGIPIIDYGENRGDGVLICTGSGYMMSIMDINKTIRYCVETKDIVNNPNAKYWIMELQSTTPFIIFAGWLSVTKPETIKELFSLVENGKIKHQSKSNFYYLCYGLELNGIKLTNLKQLEYENFTLNP